MNENNTNRNVENGVLHDEIGNITLEKGINKEKMNDQFDENKIKAEKILGNKTKTDKILKKAKWLCGMLKNVPVLGKFFGAVSDMCDLIADYNSGLYKSIPLATVVAILAAILYFICPLDVLPDAIPIIGVLDDATILYGVYMAAQNDIEAYKNWKLMHGEYAA